MFHCGCTDGQTDGRTHGRTFLPGLLSHLSGDHLKNSPDRGMRSSPHLDPDLG